MDSVYVGNLPPDIRIKDIDDFFRPFGKLVYIDVNHRANPIYALVQFDSPRNAFMAVKSRHGYNYEGYKLQLRLAENEVRNRRDGTPPPPPPSMFNNYGLQSNRGGSGNNYDSNNRMGQNYSSTSSSFQSSQWGSFDNYNNNSRSNMSQYSSDNRMNMGQQNMDYSSNNRSNMLYSSSSGRSNMSQQNMDYSSNNRSNMSYSSNDRSIMPQQNMNYSSNNRSNMPYSLNDRSNMPQQNMMNYSANNRSNMSYSSNDRSNMPQQNMMNFSNTNPSNMNYPNNNWGNNSFAGGNIDGNNFVYNAGNDPYANTSFEDNYTRGLSGAGRKWFNRYIKEGYSPEKARAKALERRTVPYMRDDPKVKPILNDPTNAALENIGTTIMSLLSNTAVDNFNSGNLMPSNSNWGGDNYQAGENFDMPGPSRGRGEPRNAVSKQQYLKSLNILKELRGRGTRTAKDRLSKKYHTQIVSDYENYQKVSGNERDKQNATSSSSDGKSYTQLLVAFKKKKQQLLIGARKMPNDRNTRSSGAFRKRVRVLMNEGNFPEIEAKALAVHRLSQLRILMSMKADYEAALKKKQDIFTPNTRSANAKTTSYRNDINYLKMYEKYRVENLSSRIKSAIRACLDRVHKHERERNLSFTKSKFTRLLASDAGRKSSSRRRRGRRSNRSRKDGVKSDSKKENNEKNKENETKENVDDNKKDEEQEANTNEEQQECEDNEEMAEEQQDGGEGLDNAENEGKDE